MIQKLFKKYIVRRPNGQCQVLIPLIELDALCDRIEAAAKDEYKKLEYDNNLKTGKD